MNWPLAALPTVTLTSKQIKYTHRSMFRCWIYSIYYVWNEYKLGIQLIVKWNLPRACVPAPPADCYFPAVYLQGELCLHKIIRLLEYDLTISRWFSHWSLLSRYLVEILIFIRQFLPKSKQDFHEHYYLFIIINPFYCFTIVEDFRVLTERIFRLTNARW